MKTLLLIAFLSPLGIIARIIPIKGCNKIIITTQDSASLNYKKALLQSLESDRSIEAKDSDLYTNKLKFRHYLEHPDPIS